MFNFGNLAYCVVKLYISTRLEYPTLYMSRSTQSTLSPGDVQSRKYNHVLPYLAFNAEDISYIQMLDIYIAPMSLVVVRGNQVAISCGKAGREK